MALETLEGVRKIGEFEVLQHRPKNPDGSVDWDAFDDMRKLAPIYIDHDVNMISFRLQSGPIKDVGINGCQVETLIQAAQMIIEKLDEKFPCRENAHTIVALQIALSWLKKCKDDRVARGVEGHNLE